MPAKDRHFLTPSAAQQRKEDQVKPTVATSGQTKASLRHIFQRQRRKFLHFLAQVIANDLSKPPK